MDKNKKLQTLTAEEIIKMVNCTATFITRKNFNFDFDNKTLTEVISNKNISRYALGKFIARCCVYRDEYLELPAIFDDARVFDGFDSELYVPSDFVLSHTLSKNLTLKMLKSKMPGVEKIGSVRNIYQLDDVINTIHADDPLMPALIKMISIIINNSIRRSHKEYFKKTNVLDIFAKTLDDDNFIIFLTNLRQYYMRTAHILTEYIWNRMVSLMEIYKEDQSNVRYSSILNAFTAISNDLVTASSYHSIRYINEFVLFNKENFEYLNNISPVFFSNGDKKTLDYFIDRGIISPDDCDKIFSVNDNFENFVKCSKISDDKIKTMIVNGYSPTNKELNKLSKLRPDVFASVLKDVLGNNIGEKIRHCITGDVKRLVDTGLIRINIDVEIEDEDLVNLYLQLNTDK